MSSTVIDGGGHWHGTCIYLKLVSDDEFCDVGGDKQHGSKILPALGLLTEVFKNGPVPSGCCSGTLRLDNQHP
jgi:hypothetical protein